MTYTQVMSYKGLEIDPKKTELIKNWPRPKTVMDMRSLLGFTNYYRDFIPKYTQVVKPLYQLISGKNPSNNKNKSII